MSYYSNTVTTIIVDDMATQGSRASAFTVTNLVPPEYSRVICESNFVVKFASVKYQSSERADIRLVYPDYSPGAHFTNTYSFPNFNICTVAPFFLKMAAVLFLLPDLYIFFW